MAGGSLARHRVGDAHARRARGGGPPLDCFSILRPTSPFRRARHDPAGVAALHRRHRVRLAPRGRAVPQHPGKMWVRRGRPDAAAASVARARRPPWHSSPYQALPPVYVQNASLEIAWTRTVRGDRHDRRHDDRAVLHPGHEGSTSTIRATGGTPSISWRPAPRSCRRSR